MNHPQHDRSLFEFDYTSREEHSASDFYSLHYRAAQLSEQIMEAKDFRDASDRRSQQQVDMTKEVLSLYKQEIETLRSIHARTISERNFIQSHTESDPDTLLQRRLSRFIEPKCFTKEMKRQFSNEMTNLSNVLADIVRLLELYSERTRNGQTLTQDEKASLSRHVKKEAQILFPILVSVHLKQVYTLESKVVETMGDLTARSEYAEQRNGESSTWRDVIMQSLRDLYDAWERYAQNHNDLLEAHSALIRYLAPSSVTKTFMRDMMTLFSDLQYGTQKWINASQLCHIYTTHPESIQIFPHQRLFADILPIHPENTLLNIHTNNLQSMDTCIYAILKKWFHLLQQKEKGTHPCTTDAMILVPQIERIRHWKSRINEHLQSFSSWSKSSETNPVERVLFQFQTQVGSSSRADIKKEAPEYDWLKHPFKVVDTIEFRHTIIIVLAVGCRFIIHPITSGFSGKLRTYLGDRWKVEDQNRFLNEWKQKQTLDSTFVLNHPLYQAMAATRPDLWQVAQRNQEKELAFDVEHVHTALPVNSENGLLVVDQIWQIIDASNVGRDVKASRYANAWYRSILLARKLANKMNPKVKSKQKGMSLLICNDTLSLRGRYPISTWMKCLQLLPASSQDGGKIFSWSILSKAQLDQEKNNLKSIRQFEEDFLVKYFFDARGEWKAARLLDLHSRVAGYASFYDSQNDRNITPKAYSSLLDASICGASITEDKKFHSYSLSFSSISSSRQLIFAEMNSKAMLREQQARKSKTITDEMPDFWDNHNPLAIQRGWGTRSSPTPASKIVALDERLRTINGKHLVLSATRRPQFCYDAMRDYFQSASEWKVVAVVDCIEFLQHQCEAHDVDAKQLSLKHCVNEWALQHQCSQQARWTFMIPGFRLIKNLLAQKWKYGITHSFVLEFQMALFNDERNDNGEVVRAIFLDSRSFSPIRLKNTYYLHEMEPLLAISSQEQVVSESVRSVCSLLEMQENRWDVKLSARSNKTFTYVSTFLSEDSIRNLWHSKLNGIQNSGRMHSELDVPWTFEEQLLVYLLSDIMNRSSSGPDLLAQKFARAICSASVDCLHHRSFHRSEDPSFECVLPRRQNVERNLNAKVTIIREAQDVQIMLDNRVTHIMPGTDNIFFNFGNSAMSAHFVSSTEGVSISTKSFNLFLMYESINHLQRSGAVNDSDSLEVLFKLLCMCRQTPVISNTLLDFVGGIGLSTSMIILSLVERLSERHCERFHAFFAQFVRDSIPESLAVQCRVLSLSLLGIYDKHKEEVRLKQTITNAITKIAMESNLLGSDDWHADWSSIVPRDNPYFVHPEINLKASFLP